VKLSDITHVIYQPGAANLQSACYADKDGRLRVLYTAPRPFEAEAPDNQDKLAEDHLRDLNETRWKGEPEFVMMTFEEAQPQISAAEDRQYVAGWREISEQTWRGAMNCLPPCRWRTERGVELFYVSEALTSNIHSFYAALNGRYFTRNCRTTVQYADMVPEVYEFAKNHHTNQHEKVIPSDEESEKSSEETAATAGPHS
jgi:hypothetical protein